MLGKVFITRTGYDPQLGQHVKDPYLGDHPSLGACRPDVRRHVKPGDHIFTISGKVGEVPQFVMGGFTVKEKIPAIVAHRRFPDQRLRLSPDGQLDGNIIVNGHGRQHRLDNHSVDTFDRRTADYVVGHDCVALVTPSEITRGREETLDFLCDLLQKTALRPFDLIGRSAKTLSEDQVLKMYEWLKSLKDDGSKDPGK